MKAGVRREKSTNLLLLILSGADTKSLLSISSEFKALATKAKENKLKPEEFIGGTFTISNLGMMGVKQFTAIINGPQARSRLAERQRHLPPPSVPMCKCQKGFVFAHYVRECDVTQPRHPCATSQSAALNSFCAPMLSPFSMRLNEEPLRNLSIPHSHLQTQFLATFRQASIRTTVTTAAAKTVTTIHHRSHLHHINDINSNTIATNTVTTTARRRRYRSHLLRARRQACILAIGGTKKLVVPNDGPDAATNPFVAKSFMAVTLSSDHRI
eukprot:6180352-Pleurochrysis_carterae.AAC.1